MFMFAYYMLILSWYCLCGISSYNCECDPYVDSGGAICDKIRFLSFLIIIWWRWWSYEKFDIFVVYFLFVSGLHADLFERSEASSGYGYKVVVIDGSILGGDAKTAAESAGGCLAAITLHEGYLPKVLRYCNLKL